MTSYDEKLSNNLKKALAQSATVPVETEKLVVEEKKPNTSSQSNPFDGMRNSIGNLKVLIGKARLGSAADADRALNELGVLKNYVDMAQSRQT